MIRLIIMINYEKKLIIVCHLIKKIIIQDKQKPLWRTEGFYVLCDYFCKLSKNFIDSFINLYCRSFFFIIIPFF